MMLLPDLSGRDYCEWHARVDRMKMFVELVVGCQNPCPIRCAATTLPIQIAPVDLLLGAEALYHAWPMTLPPLRPILFGRGEPVDWTWDRIEHGMLSEDFCAAAEITLPTNTPQKLMSHIFTAAARRIWLRVASVEDVNRADGLRRWAMGLRVTPMRGVDISEILRHAGGWEISLRSLGKQDQRYLGPEIAPRLGLTPQPIICEPGFVVERALPPTDLDQWMYLARDCFNDMRQHPFSLVFADFSKLCSAVMHRGHACGRLGGEARWQAHVYGNFEKEISA